MRNFGQATWKSRAVRPAVAREHDRRQDSPAPSRQADRSRARQDLM